MENITRQEFEKHKHEGGTTPIIPTQNIFPIYYMTSTELTAYLLQETPEGTIFINFDGTNYGLYIRINNTYKKATLS